MDYLNLSEVNQAKARRVLAESGIAQIWEGAGCRVNIVGSLRMGLMAWHRDIDLHVYSVGITIARSFAIMAEVAACPRVSEITCINGLHTDEHCVAWHVKYTATDGEEWKFDIIHIEEGTTYDGFFERMADRITEIMTPGHKSDILRLKFEVPDEFGYKGVEFYEAVIGDGITSVDEMKDWINAHRQKPHYYWIP